MKEHPILFSTPMVQAILEGRKTMTRRIIKDKQSIATVEVFKGKNGCENLCPYGKPGDLLWVREKWESESNGGKWVNFYAGNIEVRENKAYEHLTKWKPSIHMPKSAARIWLQTEEVRVERLNDITEEDAIEEGVETLGLYPGYNVSARGKFEGLWNLINGDEAWDANPWVWVVKYKILSTTGKPEISNNQ